MMHRLPIVTAITRLTLCLLLAMLAGLVSLAPARLASAVTPGPVVASGNDGLGRTAVPGGLLPLAPIRGLAVPTSGGVVAWGGGGNNSRFGQTIVPASAKSGVTAIAGGGTHSLALKDGTVIVWGNTCCRIPDGAGLSGVIDIKAALGEPFSLALKSDGSVVAWGDNGLGIQPNDSTLPPDLKRPGAGVIAIAQGATLGLALMGNGTVRAWGRPYEGQLAVPPEIQGSVKAIGAGLEHGLALTTDGRVFVWGGNRFGQQNMPGGVSPLGGLTNVKAIAAGWLHSLALKNDGSVVAWGYSQSGQTDVPAELRVANSGVTAIAGGGIHSLALMSDGSVRGWGGIGVGDPTQNPANVPASLRSDGTDIAIAIAAGGSHSLAITAPKPTATDTTGPTTSNVVITPAVTNAAPTITALVSDVSTGNSNIATAELFLDSPGANGTGTPMSAQDGAFNSPTEYVTASPNAVFAGLPEGNHTVFAHGKDAAGNWGPSASATVLLDKTPPTIKSQVDGTLGLKGWYTSDVTVSFTCNDPPGAGGAAASGLASCTGGTTLTAETAGQDVTGTATDNAGNSATTKVTVKIDKTPPTVTFTGNAGTYTADQQVNITCAATDNLSGIYSQTCPNTTGPAYSFTLGDNTVLAVAKDSAGLQGEGSASFKVTVTAASLATVTARFVTDPSVRDSLIEQSNSIATEKNPTAKANKRKAYQHLVNAQTGKSLTADQAAILIKLVNAL